MIYHLATAVVAALSFAVSTPQVDRVDDYGKALAATRADQRPLLIVLDDSTKSETTLDASRLAASGDGAKLLTPFRVCHVDASTAYGKQVAEKFHATQFPHAAIIDKTGAVVLAKKSGKITDGEWSEMLAKYKSGERSAPVAQTVFYGGDLFNQGSSASNPAYCPTCQRKAMGLSF